MQGGELHIAAADRIQSPDRPWLISAGCLGEAFLLRWDYAGHGPYQIALRQYQPSSAALPAGILAEGENVVLLHTRDGQGKPRVTKYKLVVEAGEPAIPPEERIVRRGRPGLLSVNQTEAGYLLAWSSEVTAADRLAVDRIVAQGDLVTLQSLSDAAIDYAQSGFEIALGLVATMVLFLGLMKVGEDAGIVQLVARLFYPIIRFLFPDVPKDHPANGAIVMNWTTTLLGLGNAATPFGLKAMQELQSLNPHKDVASDSQVMLLGYNTAGLALIPTTLLAVRKAAGCSDPFEIIGTCVLAGFVATVTAIVMVKLLGRLPVFSVRAAAAEAAGGQGAEAAAPDGAPGEGE
ncbi:MAG: hypothetical protein KKB50_16505 [Planctomycetes bacterium]|nr:hypothetical protein [Planctomycetota bacterium]